MQAPFFPDDRASICYNATSPISLIKQANCALFAASATRQKSLLLLWLGSFPYCCACPGCCCWDCCCGCDCDVGPCDCGKEVEVRWRRCGCEGKYWEGWLAEGEGKGAEDEEHEPEVFEEAMGIKGDSSVASVKSEGWPKRFEMAGTLSRPGIIAKVRHTWGGDCKLCMVEA